MVERLIVIFFLSALFPAGDMSISSFFRNVNIYFKITSRISVCFRDVICLSEIPSRNNLFLRYEITAFTIASRNCRVFCYGISISEIPLHNSSKYRPHIGAPGDGIYCYNRKQSMKYGEKQITARMVGRKKI